MDALAVTVYFALNEARRDMPASMRADDARGAAQPASAPRLRTLLTPDATPHAAAWQVAKDLEDPFVGPPNVIPLAHLHAAFHEELHTYAAASCALLQEDAGVAEAALELDASSAAAAAAAMRAVGGGAATRAVVGGSVYCALHRRLVPRMEPRAVQAGAPAAEEPPPSPRPGIMRFFA